MNEDELAPMRGIVYGIGFSLILWAIIGIVIWLILQ